MRLRSILPLFLATLLLLPALAGAQPLSKPEIVELWNIIPSGERAITSLVATPSGEIFGGTSGRNAHLFVFDLASKTVKDLDTIPGRGGIHRSLVVDSTGKIYAGTYMSAEDQAKMEEAYGGGHIYVYKPKDSALSFDREDLGIPLPGEGIYAMILDEGRGLLFGMTSQAPTGKAIPQAVVQGTNLGGHLFVFDLATRQAKDLGAISGNIPYEARKAISQALVQDAAGNVYTSGANGRIVKYDVAAGQVVTLDAKLPALKGREPYACVDGFVKAPDGTIYGGTSDGYLFTFDPQTDVVRNLGKPIRQHDFQGLAFGKDGILYGIAGEELGMARAFSYNPATHSFELGGIPTMNPGAGCSIGDMVLHPSGAIVAGEKSRIANLRIWAIPEQ